MDSISTLLQKASKAYYNDTPFMSNEEFDFLSEKYGHDEVGAPTNTTKKVKHAWQLFSLQKVYEGEDDYPFDIYNAIKSPKLDGAAISLLYSNGRLISASTRGDGIEGEDITDKAYLMDSIPNVIDFEYLLQVTGEVVAPKSIDNARNYAAGALNLKDLDKFKERNISFVAYGHQSNLECRYSDYVDAMLHLSILSFKNVLDDGLDIYPTDGVVYRIRSGTEFNKLGYTSKHPRGAFALKVRSDIEIKETTLLEVSWQLGKGGKVTPVAIFEEVVIEDAHITRASLHNCGFVEDLDLHIGDTLLITRAGGIIPRVVGKV